MCPMCLPHVPYTSACHVFAPPYKGGTHKHIRTEHMNGAE